ncbi:MAG: tRNA (guanosine(37)-N1)-methyltransferase TrmD [Candidatus Magasanikbacteria bacterium CG10_big_fil_rev_8_21_14_0_10_40_10]|uniref:tRNA (guanine-N(1)-)-methyltransferase n=1 Tax=Candidatus Magasanikbacteria bacterium CG10_big_fil_rev_8_21_14_0_10_40_10 TaxID=1974648 RepID=A0A2M6W2U7_9BACT|nr:MAG: tRNA (guanosine(37)-N1)-methyltransferase TrmD [Candidatus Magasanikbacteria bacterium CG10_big_fil_rev_8_21_14_0_10_40_10]
MKFNIITVFPEIIIHYGLQSILGRAQKNNLIEIKAVNLRDFASDNHRTVDDTPYGGGPGMVMKAEPIYLALKSIKAIPFSKADGLTKLKTIFSSEIRRRKKTILLSPRGRQFDQRVAEKWARLDEITFVCGRYEGVDQRVADKLVDEEISIGPYVLAGGELGALVIIEAVSRLLPGVLGNQESLAEETFSRPADIDSAKADKNRLNQAEYPQYTKPADFKGWKVPEILLSGNHKKIKEWREKN